MMWQEDFLWLDETVKVLLGYSQEWIIGHYSIIIVFWVKYYSYFPLLYLVYLLVYNVYRQFLPPLSQIISDFMNRILKCKCYR